jgi:hypothetical protein
MSVWLFSYGTLRQPEVQQALFGRMLETHDDALAGFTLSWLTITDPQVIATSGSNRHPILSRSDDPADTVAGSSLLLTGGELSQADAYEVGDYARVVVRLKSGRHAFVYVAAKG